MAFIRVSSEGAQQKDGNHQHGERGYGPRGKAAKSGLVSIDLSLKEKTRMLKTSGQGC
jgi:hypothetical protein